jgi:hypothetical protein
MLCYLILTLTFLVLHREPANIEFLKGWIDFWEAGEEKHFFF